MIYKKHHINIHKNIIQIAKKIPHISCYSTLYFYRIFLAIVLYIFQIMTILKNEITTYTFMLLKPFDIE